MNATRLSRIALAGLLIAGLSTFFGLAAAPVSSAAVPLSTAVSVPSTPSPSATPDGDVTWGQ
ncbi:hypothetical protein [Streptomyces sp. TLI_171]|uniref:hypothetical protein n=1 Tax=Streptomyces sp. TLI_171 TaxID=1938859 RepID=UPI000C17D988|nr:hypothetical protein [Streptomyces sp. TLI_171]RKE22482.1 hypothetical protein BX266_5926 [Streptomyces sp. TLI_171]